MTFEIRLIERGPAQLISREDWTSLDLDIPMTQAEKFGLVRLVRTPVGVLVGPLNYVGEMRMPGGYLHIAAKSPTMLAAMEAMALKNKTKQPRQSLPDLLNGAGRHTDPVRSFVMALKAVLSEGFPWHYTIETKHTSHPRGKIDVGSTVKRFASRGIKHRVVVNGQSRNQDSVLASVVRAANETLSGAPGSSKDLLTQATILIAAIDIGTRFSHLTEAIQAAERLLNELPPAGPVTDLVACSLALLRAEFAMAGVVTTVQGGLARFRNLERLWEQCVLRLVERSFSESKEVADHGLRGRGIRLFADGGPEIDPDVVIFSNAEVSAVIDAKYKRLQEGQGSANDLYQIAAYTRSTSARFGMIVHFTDEEEKLSLVGITKEGAPVLTVSLSPNSLQLYGEDALLQLLNRHPLIRKSIHDSLTHGLSQPGAYRVPDLASDIFLGP